MYKPHETHNRQQGQRELPVIELAYDLGRWTASSAMRFPRIQRKGLGDRIERQAYEVLDCLLEAKFCVPEVKPDWLCRANLALVKYRFSVRVALELRCFSKKMHEEATRRAYDIGVQVGSWLKSARNYRPPEPARTSPAPESPSPTRGAELGPSSKPAGEVNQPVNSTLERVRFQLQSQSQPQLYLPNERWRG